jgi:hypothetical protein
VASVVADNNINKQQKSTHYLNDVVIFNVSSKGTLIELFPQLRNVTFLPRGPLMAE